jgi:internalin A
MSDIEIIKQIEKELNIKLKKLDEIKYNSRCYTLNLNGHITGLILYECEIKDINRIISFLENLNNLNRLSLHGNQISDISPLQNLRSLSELELSMNQIIDISPLKNLNNLSKLALRHNQISDISALKNLNNLSMLYLYSNQISDISPLKNLIKLDDLDLRKNPIEELPAWITDFNMEILWKDIWSDYGYIFFYDNPLKSPPIEIVKQGKEDIKNYFNSLKGKTVKLNEVKILLVGEGLAGKTSLLKQLQGLNFDENESQTHGINVLSLSTNDIKGMENIDKIKDWILHFWDFGGQEIMHASHQFFMTKRSLYILVLDSRTDSKKYYWLKHIEKFGGDSPLIVCMNKIDANPNYNIRQKDINEQFSNIKNRFYRISCNTKKNLSEVINCLIKTIPETSLFGTEISLNWMNIKNQLIKETQQERYISRERFIKICRENNVADASSQHTLLQYLHDLGIVLYFKQFNLADIYVLDPHWVTIGVYKVINSGKINDGILNLEDLDYILNTEKIKKNEYDPAKEKKIKYNQSEQRYLISIMEQFELCYEYNKEKTFYIIPDLLPEELANEPKLNKGKPLCFIMKYDYLTSPIMPKLMIRLKNDIIKENQWKYGMILNNDEFKCKAKIKADEQNKTIKITIQGEQLYKQRYFSVIRFSLLDINKKFENLKVDEYIPLPYYPDFNVEYQELLGYEKAGKDEYFVGKLGKSFSVSEMLDSVISKEERAEEKQKIKIDITIDINIQITQNITDAQSLFKNLKQDILDEADIEIEDEKEIKRIKNELKKIEKALNELKTAAEAKKEPEAGTKTRFKEFINNISDKNSKINKALELVSNGTETLQKFGRLYNKFAPFCALPSIPDIFFGMNSDSKEAVEETMKRLRGSRYNAV